MTPGKPHTWSLLLLVPVVLFLVAACEQDQGESGSAKDPDATRGDPRMKGILRPEPPEKRNAPELRLAPPKPTAETEQIRAGLSGCLQPRRYAWSVNGRSVEGAEGPILSEVALARGDLLEVEVRCGDRPFSATAEVGNAPPRVTAVELEDHQLRAGQEIVLLPEAHDADGDLVDFRVRWRVDGEDLTWIDGLALPGDQVHTGSTIELTIIPNDGIEDGPEFVAESLTVPEQPPEFISALPETFEMQPFRYRAEAVDPDGGAISYRLEEAPEGMTIDSASGELTWTIPPDTRGEIPVRIVAEDATGQQAVQTFTLKLEPEE